MLRIRLTRKGAKKDPHYRVVVAERSSPRDGRFIEIVGHYNPAVRPVRLQLKLDRIDYWIAAGAQPSDTVRALVRRVRERVEEPSASASGEQTKEQEVASAPESEEATEAVEQEA